MGMSQEEATNLIFQELEKAKRLYSDWPSDPVHAGAVIAEESGELTQATIDFFYKKENRGVSFTSMRIEAAQVGAMAIRFLMGLDDYYSKG